MNNTLLFPATLASAHDRIGSLNPRAYARTRNALEGAVSGLSPYVTHGFVTLNDILNSVTQRHEIDHRHKFIFELGWREYFRHLWRHHGDGILNSLHAGPLPESSYAPELPADIREGRTGLPVVDQSVRALYSTGYLHNHARMWLASYIVHLRKIHWRAGADWLYAHLLDGDLASNHLSWQWVAGTASSKPYLFNAENVARYAPPAWHCGGSVIDTSYEALDVIARTPGAVVTTDDGEGIVEPPLHHEPSMLLGICPPNSRIVAGRDVWLIHPWALREPPETLPADTLLIGLFPLEFHKQWAWSARRWSFVGERISALKPLCWFGDVQSIEEALHSARSVQAWSDPHIEAYLPAMTTCRAEPPLFADPGSPCASFTQWWNRVTRDLKGS